VDKADQDGSHSAAQRGSQQKIGTSSTVLRPANEVFGEVERSQPALAVL
jgi:hypothetical protein